MSVPPQIIQVKRKRNDDGPVTFLRIEQSTKRHRSGAFLYQRRDPEAALGVAANGPAGQQREQQLSTRPPTITPTRPGEENLPLDAVKRSHAAAMAASKPTTPQKTRVRPGGSPGRTGIIDPRPQGPRATKHAAPSGSVQAALPTVPASVASRVMIEPRRFHLSRRHMAERQSSMSSRVTKASHICKGLVGPATFVERSSKRKRSGEPKTPVTTTIYPAERTSQQAPTAVGDISLEIDGGSVVATAEQPRKLKMPSKRAAVSRPSGPRLPESFVNRWDTDMDQLAREMNDYTLELIARDLEKIKERDEAEAPMPKSAKQTPVEKDIPEPRTTALSPSPRRFKPRAPGKRYTERHPEAAGAALAAGAETDEPSISMEVDVEDTSDTEEDDGDYIIDTYVRVAADCITTDATPDQVGLLVLDNEPDIDYFYGEESDSEEEYEDDEDENAENYYTADYPDDEVASGDEFDRDAYLYQMGMSEFDGASGSDSEDDEDQEGNPPDRFKITIGLPQNLPQLY